MKVKVPVLLLSTASSIFIFTTLSFFIVWLGFPAEKPDDSFKDALTFAGNIFSGATTFGAAIVAGFLFNDWRDEKKYELENTLLTNILLNLKPIFIELMIIRSDSEILKRIGSQYIVKTSFLNRDRLDLYNATINLFSDIKIYSDIIKDDSLTKLYFQFDKHCFCLGDFHKDLFLKRYRRYYELCMQSFKDGCVDTNLNFDILREYNPVTREILAIEIAEIEAIFKPLALSSSINKEVHKVSFDEWLNETIKLHDKIRNYCVERLSPPDKALS